MVSRAEVSFSGLARAKCDRRLEQSFVEGGQHPPAQGHVKEAVTKRVTRVLENPMDDW